MSVPTKEEISNRVAFSRKRIENEPRESTGIFPDRVIVALSSDRDEWRELASGLSEALSNVRNQLASEEACHLGNLATLNKESVVCRSENSRLRAERDEVVALLESYGHDLNWSAKMESLRAKMRTP